MILINDRPSTLMMSSMLLSSSSCVLLILLCISHECNARHLSTINDHALENKAKLLSHSTIKGLGDDDLNVEKGAKLKDETNTIDNEHFKKDMNKDQKMKKFKEFVRRHLRQHQPKSITFQVPPKNKRKDQQPGFNLDYSPPKTHPPSHN